MKIIYVFERRHGYAYDESMFGMNYFIEKGHLVEVWSTVYWTFGDNIAEPINKDLSGRTHYINDFFMLNEEMKRIQGEQCFFLVYPYHAYNDISCCIRRTIKKYGYSFANITESPNCIGGEKIKYSHLIAKELTRSLFEFSTILFFPFIGKKRREKKSITMRKRDFFTRFWGPILYKSKYNFVTTDLMFNSFPNLLEIISKRNVLIHSESYDEYLQIKDIANERDGKYIVFIDQYLAGHSDFQKNGKNIPISQPEKYYNDLKRLFNAIEKEYKCRVIVAAHPKAEYKGKEFGEREIIYGKTKQLVKTAELVIFQYSTSIGLILLYHKTYINIYSNSFFENCPMLKDTYAKLREELKCNQLDISNSEVVETWKDYVMKYDQNIYEQYIDKYIVNKNGVREMTFYESIAEVIDSKKALK